MTLTNQNLMTLSKFALKAKKHIGLVKAVEMFNNQQYACDILVQATLSDNDELIDLTKKISSEFNVGTNLISAIESYISSLQAKNATDDLIHTSKYFLTKLTHNLYGVNVDGTSYRHAVEKLIRSVEIKESAFCINLAREFYRFWRNASRSLTETHNEQTLKLNIQKEAFTKLWDNIEEAFFSDAENWPLTLYTESMRQIGLLEKDIDISYKIAKVITVEVRNEHSNPDETYRDAINRTQHLFSSQNMQALFLMVSREFYHFWVGNTPKIINVL